MKFKTISEILNESEESDLFKCYLAVKRESGHRWWSYKGFAGNKYFIQVTEDNIDSIELDKSMPILNYNTDIVEQMLKKGCKESNIYNLPEFIKNSGSKKQFHKLVGEDTNLPKTVYTKTEALKIGFPIIAKPTSGHSGIGIQVIKSQEDFDKADHSKFDLYSQFIDKAYEHRFFNFKGKPFFWMERKPMNEKAKTGSGKNDEEMNFQYIKHDVNKIPEKYIKVIEKYCKIMKDLPYICFDIMEDKEEQIYIIESNSQPGVPFDSTVEIYKLVFEDFYGRPVNKKTLEILNEYSKDLDKRTLESDKQRFKIEL
jgi:glutathione synthase/RimK-type ligase-like ATP-grasp enzyme